MVSIHIVPIFVYLIIRVISSRFRFKCGVVRLSERRLWKDLCTNKQYPTLVQYEAGTERADNTYQYKQ